MRTWVNTLVGTISVLSFASASSAWAELSDEWKAESERFTVAIALTSGILIQEQTGETSTIADILTPNPWPTNIVFPAPFRPPTQGAVNAISPNVGANIEFMAPGMTFLPAAPRFFATAEILPTFASSLTVALEGAATEFILFTPEQMVPNTNFGPASIGGQGSRLDTLVMTTVVAVNAGFAFEMEAKEKRLRIKPSVGWIRWGVQGQGKVLAAFKNDPTPPPVIPPVFGPDIRLVEVTGSSADFFNAVGPALEVELELEKRGPVRPSLYLIGAAYHTVGNDTLVFQTNTDVNDLLGTAVYGATWSLQVAPWTYRAGLGFRVRWVGR